MVCVIGDAFGRRREIMLAGCLYVSGSLLSALAKNFTMLVIARLVYGVGIGFAMHGAPTFISEISPPSVRGTLVSMKEAAIVVGMILGYLIGYLFTSASTSMDGGWRYVFGVGLIFGSVVVVGFYFLPPSPRWLRLKSINSPEDYPESVALDALRRYRGDVTEDELMSEMAEIDDSLVVLTDRNGGSKPSFVADLLEMVQQKRACVAGFGLVLLQQVTGQPSVLYYATSILQDAGFGSNSTLAATMVAVVKLIATCVTVLNVDKFGRRILLRIGISMMVVSLVGMGFVFQASPQNSDDSYDFTLTSKVMVVLCLMVYVSGYQVGFGPISWLMVSEVFPLHIRGTAIGAAVVVNFASNLGMTYSYLPVKEALTTQGNFWMYAAISVVAILFVQLCVPETKGKSLEEIQGMLQSEPTSEEPEDDYAKLHV
eukprot:TRINITY_DN20447_c0_g1_i1.p1 TRINITY_DN20447_c0_g1~~TRINITY_DN20447_c0_g1_i1.p1  ORF type:complete len:428 (+),score=93.91 TRINITY_DN20447_c0_g1_i1:369-1652(+)